MTNTIDRSLVLGAMAGLITARLNDLAVSVISEMGKALLESERLDEPYKAEELAELLHDCFQRLASTSKDELTSLIVQFADAYRGK